MIARLAAVPILLWAVCPMLNAQRWGTPVRIDAGWNTHEIAYDSTGQLYLVWSGVGLARSSDGGRTWSATQYLGGAMWASNPDIAVDAQDRVYVVFSGDPTFGGVGARWQLYLTESADRGQTWSVPVQIAATSLNSQWPRLVIDSKGTLHVIWQDLTYGSNGVNAGVPPAYFSHIKSTDDAGQNWNVPDLITDANWGWTLDAAVDSHDRLYAALPFDPGNRPIGVYLYQSSDGGATWSGALVVAGSLWTALAVDAADAVHLIYSLSIGNYVSNQIYVRSDDGGATWSAAETLGASQGQTCCYPEAWNTIAVDPKKNVLAAWMDGSSGIFQIYFRRSPNQGRTWLKTEQVTNTPVESTEPSLFVDRDSVVHLVWNVVASPPPNFDASVYYLRGPLKGN